MNNHSIISNSLPLADGYLPTELIARQAQMEKLRAVLLPLTKKRPIKHLWIHGPPGSGKTCIAKALLNEFEERHGIKGMYVNAWDHDTFFSILDRMVRDFRILSAERLSTLYKLEQFEKYLQNRPFLLILDEMDKPSPRERDSIIYNLAGIPNIGLICICNSRYFFQVLDKRVRSRLDPLLVEFPAYKPEEILEILRQRAEESLKAGSCRDEVLRKVAHLSKGDARVALQTLKHAANSADVFGAERIQLDHVQGGVGVARSARKRYLLAKLSDHHQLIYGIIQDFGQIRSGELWQEYLRRCTEVGLQSAASRTFSLYVKRLEEVGLILGTRALGVKGNVRIFWVRNG